MIRFILLGVAALLAASAYANWSEVVNKYYVTTIWVQVNWLNQQPLIGGGNLKSGARVVRFDWPIMTIDEPVQNAAEPG